MKSCLICDHEVIPLYNTKILGKYDTRLLYCQNCHFSFFENPTWLEESYIESINITDTGACQRSIENSKNLSILLFFGLKLTSSTFLDYGGGHGLLTRLMRDNGWNWRWFDPYTSNILAKGFSEPKLSQYGLISSFETFEHFEKPLEIIKKLLQHSENIFFSTEVYQSQSPPKISDWDYFAPHHGQHISFYNLKTLHFIAKECNLYFYSNGSNLHFFTKKKSLRLTIIFHIFKNNKWMKLLRELIFLYIKQKKQSKILEDSNYLENKRAPIREK